MEEPKFFAPLAEIRHTANYLPHWQQPGATYFVTFRMSDSIPLHLREDLDRERAIWLRFNPPPWSLEIEREYHERFAGAVDRWLDAGEGSCLLRDPSAADVVAKAPAHFDGTRHFHFTRIVMPNHVHALFTLARGWTLEKVLHSWKSFTAHKLVSLPGAPRPFWQEDYFDRLVRDADHFANCVRYIRRSPTKARIRADEFVHYESEMAKTIR